MTFHFLTLLIIAAIVLGWSDKDERNFQKRKRDNGSEGYRNPSPVAGKPPVIAVPQSRYLQQSAQKARNLLSPPKVVPIHHDQKQFGPLPTSTRRDNKTIKKPEVWPASNREAAYQAFIKPSPDATGKRSPPRDERLTERAGNAKDATALHYRGSSPPVQQLRALDAHLKDRREILEDAVRRRGHYQELKRAEREQKFRAEHLQKLKPSPSTKPRGQDSDRAFNKKALKEQQDIDARLKNMDKRPTGFVRPQTRPDPMNQTFVVENPQAFEENRPKVRPVWGKPFDTKKWKIGPEENHSPRQDSVIEPEFQWFYPDYRTDGVH